MQQSALVREPGKYKIAGKPFGSKEPYGNLPPIRKGAPVCTEAPTTQ